MATVSVIRVSLGALKVDSSQIEGTGLATVGTISASTTTTTGSGASGGGIVIIQGG